MGKHDPELARLLDGVRGAALEQGRLAELARTMDERLADAARVLAAAHADLDRYLVGGSAPEPAVEPAAGDVPQEDGDELATWRRKAAAGLIDEAPCSTTRVHDPHQWDDELGAVFCAGVAPEVAVADG